MIKYLCHTSCHFIKYLDVVLYSDTYIVFRRALTREKKMCSISFREETARGRASVRSIDETSQDPSFLRVSAHKP